MKQPAYRVTLTGPAAQDLVKILDWSLEQFGEAAADRYEVLIGQALIDLGENPFRPGAKHRPELPGQIYIFHLAGSRDHVAPDERVKTPRHILIYRVGTAHVEVLRIIHDSRDLARHLPES